MRNQEASDDAVAQAVPLLSENLAAAAEHPREPEVGICKCPDEHP